MVSSPVESFEDEGLPKRYSAHSREQHNLERHPSKMRAPRLNEASFVFPSTENRVANASDGDVDDSIYKPPLVSEKRYKDLDETERFDEEDLELSERDSITRISRRDLKHRVYSEKYRRRRYSLCFWSLLTFSLSCILLSLLSYLGVLPSSGRSRSNNVPTTDSSEPTFNTGGKHEGTHKVPRPPTLPTDTSNDQDDTTPSDPSNGDNGSIEPVAPANSTDVTNNNPSHHEQQEAPTSSKPFQVWKVRGQDVLGYGYGDFLGETVVLSRNGEVLAVGSPGREKGKGAIQAYKFLDSESWKNMGEPLEGVGQFGISLDMSSDGFVLAAGGNMASSDESNGQRGHVHAYQYDLELDQWDAMGDALDGDEEYENMGWSVALSGDGKKLAVGSPSYQDHNGRVQVFLWHEHTWNKLGPQVIPARHHGIGYAVSLSEDGDHLAVVSNGDPHKQPHAVQIFRRHNHTHWIEMGEPITEIGDEIDHLGQRIELSGDAKTLAVAARFKSKDLVGFTQVYKYHNGQWNKWGDSYVATPENDEDGEVEEHTAVSLDYDGSIIAIGSPYDDNNGKVGVWQIGKTELAEWKELGDTLVGPNGFGGTVTLSGDGYTLAVGSGRYDYNRGFVRVFVREPDNDGD